MRAMNLNEVAVFVSRREGGKQISIAQIKEVIRIVCRLIARNPLALAAMLRNGARK